MGYPTKIATCCYCGTRAALVLTKGGRHELACRACGAPLHELKMLPKAKTQDPTPGPKPRKTRAPVRAYSKPKRKKSKKRRKPLYYKVFEEAVDFIEDIFD